MNEMLRDMGAEYFVTLNFNRDTNYEAARKALKAWHAFVDKALLGGSWSRKARNERTFFIACVEHLDSNIHWHVMLRLCEGANTQRFEAVAEQCWEKLVKSGSLKMWHLETDLEEARYTVKDLWRQKAIELFVLSTEFEN